MSHYDANERGDLPGRLAPLAADVAWTEMEGFPLGGIYVGPDAIRTGVFERLGREWLGYSATLDSLYDAGDTIVATGWYAGTYPPTGNAMRCRFAHVWHVADGCRELHRLADAARHQPGCLLQCHGVDAQ